MAVATAYAGLHASPPRTGSYWLGFVVAIVGGLVLGARGRAGRHALRRPHLAAQRGHRRARRWCWSSRPCSGMIYGNEFRPPPSAPFSRTALDGRRGRRAVAATTCSSSARCWRVVVGAGAAVLPHRGRPADARGGLRAGGVPAARGQRGRHAAPSAGRSPRRSARWPACWSSRPSWACTRTRWTWSSSRRSPRRCVGGLDSPPGAVIGGLAVGLMLSYVTGYLGSDVTADRGAGPAAGGAADPARRPVLRGRRRGGYERTTSSRVPTRSSIRGRLSTRSTRLAGCAASRRAGRRDR